VAEWANEDLALLEQTIAEALSDDSRDDVSSTLIGLGWPELVAEPLSPPTLTALRAIALSQGRHLKRSDFIHLWVNQVLANQVNGPEVEEQRDMAVAVPILESGSSQSRLVLLPGAPTGEVVTCLRREDAASVIRLGRHDLTSSRLAAMDPTLGLIQLDTGTASGEEILLGEAAVQTWDLVEAMICLVLAEEVVGAARAAIDLSVTHVSSRHQFGQPLGGFQAVQHQLAEAFAWITALDELCHSTLASGSVESSSAATGIIARMVRQATAVSNAATQQVHGAIGYTEEYPLHGYLKRSLTLAGLLAGAGFMDRARIESGEDLWALLDLVEA